MAAATAAAEQDAAAAQQAAAAAASIIPSEEPQLPDSDIREGKGEAPALQVGPPGHSRGLLTVVRVCVLLDGIGGLHAVPLGETAAAAASRMRSQRTLED